MNELIHGALYLYRGELRSHKGKMGIASNITRLGRNSRCTLSNIKDWGAYGVATSIEAMDYELQLVADVVETPGKNAKPDEAAFDGPESDLVAGITKALKEQGYLVALVGQHKAKGSGTTVGYPDMSVRRCTWPDGLACLIEVKTATGELSGEQEDLLKLGWSYVVRSVDGARSSLVRFENAVFGHRPAKERTGL